MTTSRTSRTTRSARTLLGTSAAALGLAATAVLGASPAAAASLPVGLFGQGDPTYDGVFRQSLALLAYAAAEQEPPADAVAWLEDQQCADGGFQSFRADTAEPCAAPDSSTYSGQDTNSTGLAAAALYAMGRTAAADDAVAWLLDHQNADGGFAYYPDDAAASDSNSTGIALLGTNASGRTPSQVSTGGVSAADYLASVQVACAGVDADEDGAYAYQVDTPLSANLYATLQAVPGAAGAVLPLTSEAATSDSPRLTCPAGTTSATGPELAAGYVARTVAPTGSITCAQTGFCGSGDDVSGTAWAVLGLSAAGVGSAERDAALTTLLDAVGTQGARVATAAAPSTEDPGQLALVTLAVVSVDGPSSDATALVARIGATVTPAATTTSPSPSPTPTESGGTTSGGSLAPSGATPLTPALAGVGALLLALGAGAAVGARRGGARS